MQPYDVIKRASSFTTVYCFLYRFSR